MSTPGPTLVATATPALGRLADDIHSLFNASQKGHLHFDAPIPIAATPSPVTSALSSPPIAETHRALVTEEERLLASQLACLASQHHLSQYNRSKFGPDGALLPYVPLSIQFPAQYKDMQLRQRCSAEKQAWWPCNVQTINSAPSPMAQPPSSIPLPEVSSNIALVDVTPNFAITPVNKAGPAILASPTIDIEEEILAAIAEPIPRQAANHQLKTSETHPINVSCLIPPELLPQISANLTPPSPPEPTLFHLPKPFFLDQIVTSHPHTSSRPLHPSHTTPTSFGSTSPPLPIGLPPPIPPAPPPHPSRSSTARHGVSFASSLTPSWARPSVLQSFNLSHTSSPTPGFGGPPLLLPPKMSRAGSSESFSKLSLRAIRPIPPHFERATSAPPGPLSMNRVIKISERLLRRPADADSMDIDGRLAKRDDPMHTHAQSPYARPTEGPSSPRSPRRSPPTAFVRGAEPMPNFSRLPPPDISPIQPPPRLVGNLLLSSCPGKKVRLSGPVKGRGGVCRDLGRDLCRIKDMGVGCIVCCLDDDELNFLGASWNEYSAVARDIGLDVLRLPIPEGLGPLHPATLDGHLSRLIDSYTLKSIPILVHCRGGVGRAGLVAACWALKLGLCGWVTPTPPREEGEISSGTEGLAVPDDTVRLVATAIQVIRNRRNIKAIETYEQVRFLVAFVQYLAAGTETGSLKPPLATDIGGVD